MRKDRFDSDQDWDARRVRRLLRASVAILLTLVVAAGLTDTTSLDLQAGRLAGTAVPVGVAPR